MSVKFLAIFLIFCAVVVFAHIRASLTSSVPSTYDTDKWYCAVDDTSSLVMHYAKDRDDTDCLLSHGSIATDLIQRNADLTVRYRDGRSGRIVFRHGCSTATSTDTPNSPFVYMQCALCCDNVSEIRGTNILPCNQTLAKLVASEIADVSWHVNLYFSDQHGKFTVTCGKEKSVEATR